MKMPTDESVDQNPVDPEKKKNKRKQKLKIGQLN
jgi:hypothetical protein